MVSYTNQCIDAPDSRDYKRADFEEYATGNNKTRPRDRVIVQNQGNIGMCTRAGMVHISNGANILEYESQGFEYPQVMAIDVWNRSNKSLTLQSALKQMKDEGFIEGYVQPQTIEQIKQSIDMGYFIYTGSNNCDWSKTKTSKVYTLRTDGKPVGHAYGLVGYTDAGWLAINSYGPTWADKGYFTIPFEYTNKLYTKYSIIDKSDTFAQFKVKEKALALQLLNSEFFNLTKNTELQGHLHATNEIIRGGKF